jgi:uncharacterized glyoxalase superfamily protein PhnB
MAKIVVGTDAAVVVPQEDRDIVRSFYRDLLGFEPTRITDAEDDFQLVGDDAYWHLSILYGEFADESEVLRSSRVIYLELKADDVEAIWQKIVDDGAVVIEVPDPDFWKTKL